MGEESVARKVELRNVGRGKWEWGAKSGAKKWGTKRGMSKMGREKWDEKSEARKVGREKWS